LLSDPRVVIARRDVRSLSREKTIILALLIQLFVAGFSSFLVVGLTSLYDPGSVSASGVDMAVTGDAQDRLLEAVDEQAGIYALGFEDPDAARTAFENRRADTLVNATYVGRADGGGRRIAVTAYIPEESIRSTLIVVNIRSMLNTVERVERLQRADSLETDPVPIPQSAGASPYFGFTYTVLLPLLLFLPAFISGSIAVDTITEEIERGTLELLRSAPVSLLDIVDGKALGMASLAPGQALLWITLLSANGISVVNVVPILIFVTAASVITVTLGVVLGIGFGQRRPAQLLYSVSTLFLFAVAIVLPEHPAATIAKLAVGSPELLTYAHVLAAVVFAAAAYTVARRYVQRADVSAF
jgi:ABC-type Na+ efflux pump permease subunit